MYVCNMVISKKQYIIDGAREHMNGIADWFDVLQLLGVHTCDCTSRNIVYRCKNVQKSKKVGFVSCLGMYDCTTWSVSMQMWKKVGVCCGIICCP